MSLIKFRGRMESIRKWECGSLFMHYKKGEPDFARIHRLDFFCYVDPKTVGQFTGLKDKNKTEIYAGDFVQSGGMTLLVVFSDDKAAFSGISVDDKASCFYLHDIIDPDIFGGTGCEVIGNIHDNPELWEVQK